jgi:hypothetical protein
MRLKNRWHVEMSNLSYPIVCGGSKQAPEIINAFRIATGVHKVQSQQMHFAPMLPMRFFRDIKITNSRIGTFDFENVIPHSVYIFGSALDKTVG